MTNRSDAQAKPTNVWERYVTKHQQIREVESKEDERKRAKFFVEDEVGGWGWGGVGVGVGWGRFFLF